LHKLKTGAEDYSTYFRLIADETFEEYSIPGLPCPPLEKPQVHMLYALGVSAMFEGEFSRRFYWTYHAYFKYISKVGKQYSSLQNKG